MRRAEAALLTLAAALATQACAKPGTADAERFFREGRWFELRAVVGDSSPAVLRAAVAAAFNDVARADALLRDIMRSPPDDSSADAAYELLCRIYRRSGQYAHLGQTHGAWAAAFPDSPGMRRWAEDRHMFGRPDQVNSPPARAVLRHAGDGYPTVPVSINGIEDQFLLDTGAWQSALTDAKARKLGLKMLEETGVLEDASGTRTTFRTAIADEVAIGPLRFRDVSFAVIDPTGPLAGSELGIVGMPILLALGSVQWSRSGAIEIGTAIASADAAVSPNIAFDRSRLVLSTTVLGRSVMATLDTGANSTELNANFVDMFPEFVQEHGRAGSSQLAGIGGAKTYESIELPELVFTIGPREVAVRPVTVTRQRLAILGGECCIGNAGHDLLVHGEGFAIDFGRMALSIR